MYLKEFREQKVQQTASNTILDLAGTEIWKYEYPLDKDGKPTR